MGSDKEDLARWADLVLDGKPINIDQTIRNQAAHITALEEAVRVLVLAAFAASEAKNELAECPKNDGRAGGQTVQECRSRVRHHNVPLAIFDRFDAAIVDVMNNPIAAEAVRKASNGI